MRKDKSFRLIIITTLIMSLVPTAAFAKSLKSKPKQLRAPAATSRAAAPIAKPRHPSSLPASSKSARSGDEERVLNVKGQSRNLNMMFVLKDEKEKIKFGEIRENYREEVMKTSY